MIKSQYVSLQDAALLANKSPQTIRRLIKANKIRYRKYKTPQGFTYLVEKSTLMDFFSKAQPEDEMDELMEDAELIEEFDPMEEVHEVTPPRNNGHPPHGAHGMYGHRSAPYYSYATEAPQEMQRPEPAPPPSSAEAATSSAFQSIVSQLVQQHREDKKRLFELLETFQKRILILEDQIKQLEAPKKKKRWRWF